jgi:hypothetical protein
MNTTKFIIFFGLFFSITIGLLLCLLLSIKYYRKDYYKKLCLKSKDHYKISRDSLYKSDSLISKTINNHKSNISHNSDLSVGKYKGLCVFDYDGTIGDIPDKSNQGSHAAQLCIDKGYAVVALTANGNPKYCDKDNPDQSQYAKKLPGIHLYDCLQQYEKGPTITKLVNKLKDQGNNLECVILFDDSVEWNKTNGPSGNLGHNTTSVLNEKAGYCIWQNSGDGSENGKYEIDKIQVQIALDNCKNRPTSAIEYDIKSPNDNQYPFFICSK